MSAGLHAVSIAVLCLVISCETQPPQTNDQDKSKELSLVDTPSTGSGQEPSSIEAGQDSWNFKRPVIVTRTLAKALLVNIDGMCLELGEIPCRKVHNVSLGGIEPYQHSQYRYQDNLPLTAPISLDRIVLAACSQRAALDFSNSGSAIIYKDIEISPDGRLVQSTAIDESITRLYRRLHMRNPHKEEITEIRALYYSIYDEQPVAAALNWMTLSCFAVATSVEGVLY